MIQPSRQPLSIPDPRAAIGGRVITPDDDGYDAVRSGGHGNGGPVVVDDGIVLDLRGMRELDIDALPDNLFRLNQTIPVGGA